jgi:hypothetical protein
MLRREKYALREDAPIVEKINEGFASYVVLPQTSSELEDLLKRKPK